MTKEQISDFASQPTFTDQVTIVTFKDKTEWVGFLDNDPKNPADNNKNYWSFVKFNDNDKDKRHHFYGNDVISIVIKKKN
jgi:hypothetical protein